MNKSIRIKTWFMILMPMLFFVLLLWLLEIVFLQNFYEMSKTYDAKRIQTSIMKELSQGDLDES